MAVRVGPENLGAGPDYAAIKTVTGPMRIAIDGERAGRIKAMNSKSHSNHGQKNRNDFRPCDPHNPPPPRLVTHLCRSRKACRRLGAPGRFFAGCKLPANHLSVQAVAGEPSNSRRPAHLGTGVRPGQTNTQRFDERFTRSTDRPVSISHRTASGEGFAPGASTKAELAGWEKAIALPQVASIAKRQIRPWKASRGNRPEENACASVPAIPSAWPPSWPLSFQLQRRPPQLQQLQQLHSR
jgi:hypothetical protein